MIHLLSVCFGRGQVTDRRQRERRPVQASQIFSTKRCVITWTVGIDPVSLRKKTRT